MQVAAGATTVFLGVENAAETTAAVLSIAAAVGVPGGKPTIRKKKGQWFQWIGLRDKTSRDSIGISPLYCHIPLKRKHAY
jgi:hypothetical protein